MKIFVSYSRRDAGDFANQIQRHLSSFTYDIFTDIDSIRVGEVWNNTIEKNISNCDIFVVIVTDGALYSPHVEREVLQAQKEKKTIVPCFHRSMITRSIKWGLNDIQGVEFSDKYELARELFLKVDNEPNHKPTEGANATKTQDDLSKGSAQWNLDKAKIFENLGQYNEALKQYDEAIKKEPYNFLAKSNRDIVLEIIKRQRKNSNNSKDNKKALVIGVSYPEFKSISIALRSIYSGVYRGLKSIKFGTYDSQEISNVLKENGYDIPNNHTLIGYVNSKILKNTIYNFFTDENNKSDDTLVFYYSGYGVLNRLGKLFLAPSDMDSDHPFITGFSFDDLTDCMLGCKSRYVVTILDSVFGDLQPRKGFTAGGGEEAAIRLANNIIEEKFEKLKERVGICIMASSQGYKESYKIQEKDHSIFTYYLLEGLKGHKNAVDDEGNVTYNTLGKFIIGEIGNLPPEKRPKQTPIRKGEISCEDIILTTYPNLRKAKESHY